jgi:hypothetical protein
MKKGEYIPLNMLKITMKTTKIISDSLKKNKKQMEKKK